MEYIDEIFIGESVGNLSAIIYSLNKSIPVFNVYLICTTSNEKNLFEICSTKEVLKKRNKNRNLLVVGIAYGRDEAYDLFLYIVNYCLKNGIDDINDIGLKQSLMNICNIVI